MNMSVDVEGERRKKAVKERRPYDYQITNAIAIKKVSLLSVLLVGLIVSVISLGGCHRGHHRDRGYYHYHR